MGMEIVFSVVLLFGGIAVLVVVHICIYGRAFRSRETLEQRSTISTSSTTGMISIEDLKKLPFFHYKAAEEGNIPLDCVVCLESFKVGENCRLLPICKHSFHAKCIDSWLLKTPICPVCRTCVNPSNMEGFWGRRAALKLNWHRTKMLFFWN